MHPSRESARSNAAQLIGIGSVVLLLFLAAFAGALSSGADLPTWIVLIVGLGVGVGLIVQAIRLNRRPDRFDLQSIGDTWTSGSVEYQGEIGVLHVRRIPAGLAANDFPFVSLSLPEGDVDPGRWDAYSVALQAELEKDGRCLLAAKHLLPSTAMWYAYSSSRFHLQAAHAALRPEIQLLVGVEFDPTWEELHHMQRMIDAEA